MCRGKKYLIKFVVFNTKLPERILDKDSFHAQIFFRNEIPRLLRNDFSQLSNCTTVDLNSNEISEVEAGAFTGG